MAKFFYRLILVSLLTTGVAIAAPAPVHFSDSVATFAKLDVEDGGRTLAFRIDPAGRSTDPEAQAKAFGRLLDQRLAFDRAPRYYISLNGNDAISKALGDDLAHDANWDGRHQRPRRGTTRNYLIDKLDTSLATKPLRDAFAARGYRLVTANVAKISFGARTVTVAELGFDASTIRSSK